jgi:hypothetical protein
MWVVFACIYVGEDEECACVCVFRSHDDCVCV